MIYKGPFSDIPLWYYDFIMADPAWLMQMYSDKGLKKSPQAHYKCMPLDEIKALPVMHICKPDCLLWLWATNPMLDQAMDVLKCWGFTFKTAGHWVKEGESGKLAFGPGYIFRGAGEPYLIGTIGRPTYTSRSVRSVIKGPRRAHSQKPEITYAEAEKLMLHAKRIELFSRTPRDGWDVWGDEADKFEPEEVAG